MSGRVLVLVPQGSVPDDAAVPDVCSVAEWHGVEDLVRAVSGADAGELAALVLVSRGLRGEAVSQAAQAVSRCAVPVIEVRDEQWDGFEALELARVCAGVVSGFGTGAAWVVAEALR